MRAATNGKTTASPQKNEWPWNFFYSSMYGIWKNVFNVVESQPSKGAKKGARLPTRTFA